MKKTTLLASAVMVLLALPQCYRGVDIAGVRGAPCEMAPDSCRWPYVCGADGTCRFPHGGPDAGHDGPMSPADPADAPAPTPVDPPDAPDAADAAEPPDGPAAEAGPELEVGPSPPSCKDSDDKLCAPGICVIDRCNYDVLDIPYVPVSELPQLADVTLAPWDFGFKTQTVKHRIAGEADVAVPDGEAGSFQLVWNEVGLFARVQVKDSNLVADSFKDEYPVFDDDDVEIYIDVHGEERSSKVPSKTYNQVMFGYGRPTPRNYMKSQRRPGVSFALARTHDGYVIQAAMSWTHLDGTPVPGGYMGLDVHINDDDDGRGRDRKWAWFDVPDDHGRGNDDKASGNPRVIGRARLLPCGPKGCIAGQQ